VEPYESVPDVVRTETTRQLIILGFAVLTVVMHRRLSDPDALRLAKMWGALAVKRWSDTQARRFTELSTRMATVYNGEKL